MENTRRSYEFHENQPFFWVFIIIVVVLFYGTNDIALAAIITALIAIRDIIKRRLTSRKSREPNSVVHEPIP